MTSTHTLATLSATHRPRVKTLQKAGVRAQSAKATREGILKSATKVFAKYGYAGGSVEKISKEAKSVDRMIYYYFGNKEGLFTAVIEDLYRRMNEAESKLEINTDRPEQALREVIDFVMNYYRLNPDFVVLLNTENLYQGRHIEKSAHAAQYSSLAIEVIARILATGARLKRFRAKLSARDVYLLIVSTSYFFISNRFTLSAFLGENLEDPKVLAHWKRFVTDAVFRTVRI